MQHDPFNLHRFIDAQAPVIDRVRAELTAGCKTSHWMWFVFPQIAGLGRSATARHYAIHSWDEALAYMSQPLLAERLIELTGIVNSHEGLTADEIFGSPDDMKFHSSMTLFAEAAPSAPVFGHALQRYFRGAPDLATLALLGAD